MSSLQWHISASTDVGVKRRGRANEDAVMVIQSAFDPRPPLVVVADGMGGYKGGALASQHVIESFEREYKKIAAGTSVKKILETLVQTAHTDLKRLAEKDESVERMGSTVVAAILGPDRVGIVNVGDSRAYLYRRGELRQLSLDHSMVGELLKKGAITPEEARTHPERSMLTMSLSPKRGEVKSFMVEEKVMEGDVLLLCSDGLWSVLSHSELVTVVGALDVQPAAEKLIEMANISQAPDNVSVIVARLGKRIASPTEDDETGEN